jgi:Mrp family chromosome partitioning ATPase
MELDFWKPVLVKKLKLDPYKTLASVLAGDLRLPDAVQQLESGVAVLAACEKRSPPVRSLTTLVADTVALAVDKWDIVLVDTPPLTEYGALLNVGTVIPRLLMVVRAGFSSTATIDRFQQDLHNVGIEAFGTILNREKRYVPAWIEKPARVNDIETPSQRVY